MSLYPFIHSHSLHLFSFSLHAPISSHLYLRRSSPTLRSPPCSRFQAIEYDGHFFVNPGSATGAWTGAWNGSVLFRLLYYSFRRVSPFVLFLSFDCLCLFPRLLYSPHFRPWSSSLGGLGHDMYRFSFHFALAASCHLSYPPLTYCPFFAPCLPLPPSSLNTTIHTPHLEHIIATQHPLSR